MILGIAAFLPCNPNMVKALGISGDEVQADMQESSVGDIYRPCGVIERSDYAQLLFFLRLKWFIDHFALFVILPGCATVLAIYSMEQLGSRLGPSANK
jgi:hypothetical protein